MKPETTVNEVVEFYRNIRQNKSIEEAASLTISHFGVTPSQLVDSFNAAQLDLSRSDADAEDIHAHRNALLSHYRSN